MAFFGLFGSKDDEREARQAAYVPAPPERMGDMAAVTGSTMEGFKKGGMEGLKWGGLAAGGVVAGVVAATAMFGGQMVGALAGNKWVAGIGGGIAALGNMIGIKELKLESMANTAAKTTMDTLIAAGKGSLKYAAIVGGAVFTGVTGFHTIKGATHSGDYADTQYEQELLKYKKAMHLAKMSRGAMGSYASMNAEMPDGPSYVPQGVGAKRGNELFT